MSATDPDRPDPAAAAGSIFADALCAIDGVDGEHESLAAVSHAASLAGPGGRLTLLVVTSHRSDGERRSPAIGPTRAKEMLDRAVGLAGEAGVSCTVEVDPASPPSRVILDWAAKHSLLAIGAPATSWLGGLLAGGVAAVAESAFTTPLLVARAAGEGRPDPGPILVASDGLDGSDELVGLAGRLAQRQGKSAVLLHAVGAESGASRHRIEEQARALRRLMGGACELLVEAGSPRAVIVEAARTAGASLVVMSSRRLHGVAQVGSVSRRVVHHGDCSVLLVPPEMLLGVGAPIGA
jgi:nucleotide-binding universal stress UspA family protein